MKIDQIATTNKLLLVIVIPLLFYILDVLAFIMIPFMFAVFIALLFTPIMRWLKKRNTPQFLTYLVVVVTLFGSLFITFKVIQLSASQIDAGRQEIYEKLDAKVATFISPFQEFFGFESPIDEKTIKSIMQTDQVKEMIYGNFSLTFTFVSNTLTRLLMTLFFLLLLLAGSLNLKVFMQEILSRGQTQSVKTFITVERSISKFLKVKFLVSLATGVGFGLICYFFDISFPLFWGLFAFIVNFIQMVGSIISTIVVSIFAFIEIEAPGALLAVVLLLTGVQVIFGSIVEPILMGKSFSINIIVVLVALMFWGYLWGIAGLVLAIPMTVLLKTILGEFKGSQSLARLMS